MSMSLAQKLAADSIAAVAEGRNLQFTTSLAL